MNKFLFLASLLLVAALADELVLGQSGDSSFDISASGSNDASSLPGSPPTIAPATSFAASTSGTRSQPLAFIGGPTQPTSWDFLSQIPAAGTKWIYPDGTFKIYPRYWISTYTISFQTDCPQSGVTLTFATTGVSFIQLNGNWILTWGDAWPKVHKVTLKKPQLQCGCNTIKILVYNYYYPSPAALFYSLTQDTTGCYDCTNLGVTFYNKNTCQCECASTCACSNPAMTWFNYPNCGCACSKSLICQNDRYFNRQNCSCDCLPKCCPKGQYQDPRTCQCSSYCLPLVPCKPGYEWDHTKCDCVPICKNIPLGCPGNQQWDPVSCQCKCPSTISCKSPWVWNSQTCKCDCDIVCIATMRVDLEKCACVPIYYATNLLRAPAETFTGAGQVTLQSTVVSGGG